jgi:hypothetical protein
VEEVGLADRTQEEDQAGPWEA